MTLRRRLTLAFVASALVAAVCFSFLGMMFVYTVEDRFFDHMLAQDVPDVKRYPNINAFPPDLARQVTAGVQRGEFYGDQGRHYHVRKSGDDYLVAEVSKQLVVRPRLPMIAGMLGAMALVMALLIGGVGYLFARRAIAPLERLSRMLEASAPASLPRNFSAVYTGDEVGVLARALDQAMVRVADFVDREQHFTRDASHELRTPLAVIAGAAALMEVESLSAAGRSQLRRISDACALMQRTTDTLLMLSREQGGEAEPVRLLALVEEVVVRYDQEIDLLVDIPADVTLTLNKGVLEILLANIIGNAITHAAPGQITIAFKDDALVVTNRGALPSELEGKLFATGVRGPSSTGYGLGLPIAQRLAHRVGYHLALSTNGAIVTTTMTKR
jgi:signal transduction histidine kinase